MVKWLEAYLFSHRKEILFCCILELQTKTQDQINEQDFFFFFTIEKACDGLL